MQPSYLARTLGTFAYPTFDPSGNDVAPDPLTTEQIQQQLRQHAARNHDHLPGSVGRINGYINTLGIGKAERSGYIRLEGNGYVLCDAVKEGLAETAVARDIHYGGADAYHQFMAKIRRQFPGKRDATKAEIRAELLEAKESLRALKAQLKATEDDRDDARAELQEAVADLKQTIQALQAAEKRAIRVEESDRTAHHSPQGSFSAAGPSGSSHTLEAGPMPSILIPDTHTLQSTTTPRKPTSFDPAASLPTPESAPRLPARQPTLILDDVPPSPTRRGSSRAILDPPAPDEAMEVDMPAQPQFGPPTFSQPPTAAPSPSDWQPKYGACQEIRKRLERHLGSAKQRHAELEARFLECEMRREDARAQSAATQTRYSEAMAQLEALEALAALREEEEVEVVLELAECKDSLQAARFQHAGGVVALRGARATIDEQEERYHAQVREHVVVMAALQAEHANVLSQQEDALRAARAQYVGAAAALDAAQKKLDRLEQDNTTLRVDNEALRVENGVLRAENDVHRGNHERAWVHAQGLSSMFGPTAPGFMVST